MSELHRTLAWRLVAPIALSWVATSAGAFQAQVTIRHQDVGGNEAAGQALVSVIRHPNACEYRLEFNDRTSPPARPIGEVASDQGSPQRYTRPTCEAPAFTATRTANPRFFDEQTAYYWAMKARGYAARRLWVTPPLWSLGPIKYADNGVVPFVLSQGGFNTACFPRPFTGCFRVWPHEGPRIHLKAGSVRPQLVAHEFGHYAAGFVMGHMDPTSYAITNCAHRSFQETIAEMFMSAFLHDAEYDSFAAIALEDGKPNSGSFGALDGTSIWNGQCGANDNDYAMGKPLVQAFHQILWDLVWDNDSSRANAAMAGAFSYALAMNRGYRIDSLARDMLDHLRRTQSGEPARTTTTARAATATS